MNALSHPVTFFLQRSEHFRGGFLWAVQDPGHVQARQDPLDVTIEYPQIIKARTERNWAWLAHGRNNSTLQAGMPAGEERSYLANVAETIEQVEPASGSLGPALTETQQTPRLLAELGLKYLLDWTNDDQPYWLNVPGMLRVPYSVELNDLGLFTMRGLTGPQFLQIVKDQLDQLYADSASSGRVMALALHPFASGQPFRAKYLDQALEYITGHPGYGLPPAMRSPSTSLASGRRRSKGNDSGGPAAGSDAFGSGRSRGERRELGDQPAQGSGGVGRP